MIYSFFMPVKIIYGPDCVRQNPKEFAALGKKAYIVTVPEELGKLIGALDDVIDVLDGLGIEYRIFDQCLDSADFEFVDKLREDAYGSDCDFVIGIGGGAVIDIAKIAAVLCVNSMTGPELFSNNFSNPPLPMLAIPTTAGTGSEASYNSVLTIDGHSNKKSFGDTRLHAKIAFLDAKYTEKLPLQMARNTAVDALTHATEGLLSAKASPLGTVLAKEVIVRFADSYDDLLAENLGYNRRQTLIEAANIAGIVLAQERTLGLHALSYPLSAMRGVHHGLACGVCMAAFVEHCYPGAKEKVDYLLHTLGLSEPRELYSYLDNLLKCANTNVYTEDELYKFVNICGQAASGKPNPVPIDDEAVLKIYRKSLNIC